MIIPYNKFNVISYIGEVIVSFRVVLSTLIPYRADTSHLKFLMYIHSVPEYGVGGEVINQHARAEWCQALAEKNNPRWVGELDINPAQTRLSSG